jgi:DNA-directed RNA polymerase
LIEKNKSASERGMMPLASDVPWMVYLQVAGVLSRQRSAAARSGRRMGSRLARIGHTVCKDEAVLAVEHVLYRGAKRSVSDDPSAPRRDSDGP